MLPWSKDIGCPRAVRIDEFTFSGRGLGTILAYLIFLRSFCFGKQPSKNQATVCDRRQKVDNAGQKSLA